MISQIEVEVDGRRGGEVVGGLRGGGGGGGVRNDSRKSQALDTASLLNCSKV